MRQHKAFLLRNLQPIGSEGTMQTQTRKMDPEDANTNPFRGHGRSEGELLQGIINFWEVYFCEGRQMGQHSLVVPGVKQGREKRKVQRG